MRPLTVTEQGILYLTTKVQRLKLKHKRLRTKLMHVTQIENVCSTKDRHLKLFIKLTFLFLNTK